MYLVKYVKDKVINWLSDCCVLTYFTKVHFLVLFEMIVYLHKGTLLKYIY